MMIVAVSPFPSVLLSDYDYRIRLRRIIARKEHLGGDIEAGFAALKGEAHTGFNVHSRVLGRTEAERVRKCIARRSGPDRLAFLEHNVQVGCVTWSKNSTELDSMRKA
jgi:hypothetical protein